jgi:hypothetical protein
VTVVDGAEIFRSEEEMSKEATQLAQFFKWLMINLFE